MTPSAPINRVISALPESHDMIKNLDIRASDPGDVATIETLYPQAFPDEDLVPLVRELLGEGDTVLSLVAVLQGDLAGHVLFTACSLEGGADRVSLLAPLAVAPASQGKGLGSTLVREGLRLLQMDGVVQVYVLGDPAYYARFGFKTEARVEPPYPLPEEWRPAWQSVGLHGAAESLRGKLSVPPPWRQPALWSS